MFGYIKPKKEELLVKELHLYNSIYCGLCTHIRKKLSFFLPFSLSYDFVFLAIVRDILSENKISIFKGRCPYNPLKKKSFYSSSGIEYTALVSLIMVEKNIEDKRLDKDCGIFSPLLKIPEIYLKNKIKKHLPKELVDALSERLEKFYSSQTLSSTSDELGMLFGEVMGEALSFGLEGANHEIALSLGRSIGAFLYLIDAVDDIEKDYKKRKFNPLISQYGTPDIVKKHFKDIDVVLGALAKDAHLALALAPVHKLTPIAENIITLGLGEEAYRKMNSKGEKND